LSYSEINIIITFMIKGLMVKYHPERRDSEKKCVP